MANSDFWLKINLLFLTWWTFWTYKFKNGTVLSHFSEKCDTVVHKNLKIDPSRQNLGWSWYLSSLLFPERCRQTKMSGFFLKIEDFALFEIQNMATSADSEVFRLSIKEKGWNFIDVSKNLCELKNSIIFYQILNATFWLRFLWSSNLRVIYNIIINFCKSLIFSLLKNHLHHSYFKY